MEDSSKEQSGDDRPVTGRAHDRSTIMLGTRAFELGSGSTILQVLRSLCGEDTGVQLDPDAQTVAPGSRPAGDEGIPEIGGRLRIDREIARGGMGVVLLAWDPDLQRQVAVKTLHAHHAESADSLRRFVEEAQICGQLEHPGIVPVHELGLSDEARPYFVMKLIQGQSFEELLADGGGRERARCIRIFLSICQTVAYAHSRGVIHRDLKPGNVMVGSFGEVQVVDWGLAKVLDRESHERDRPPVAEEDSTPAEQQLASAAGRFESSQTRAGTMVGTLAYMPPEQARGELPRVDRRADVFALGAILCEILTGDPPYTAVGEELVIQAMVGDLEDAETRLRGTDADAELVELALHCLAADADDRPADASVVAQQVSDLLAAVADRAQEAQVEAAAANARAEEERRSRQIVEAKEREAQIARRQAEAERQRAEHALVDFLRLADTKILETLRQREEELWPAVPTRVPELTQWIEDAEQLRTRLPEHENALAQLRARALPHDADEDRRTHPRAPELAKARAALTETIRAIDDPTGLTPVHASGVEELEERREKLETKVAELERVVAERHTWRFRHTEDQFMHDVLAKLIVDLRELVADEARPGNIAEVRRRRELAAGLGTRSLEEPTARSAWDEAIRAIREHPAYGGLEMRAELGLLPLGPDPVSGLWEFAHLATGDVPARDADGRLELRGESGLVFVLVPGGRFWMGAQAEEPNAPGFDEQAVDGESPVTELTLDPFLLSKTLMTQGQWQEATLSNPSIIGHGRNLDGVQVTLLHPVEMVSWEDCDRVLGRLGLVLPTEAQWEYACRAGTTTRWWCGDEPGNLEGVANLADRAFVRAGGSASLARELPDLDDGFAGHSPVNEFRANPWGFHDVHGNLSEWCRDGHAPYSAPPRPGDGERTSPGGRARIHRGGCFGESASACRSARRESSSTGYKASALGVRPARRLGDG